jgi:GTP cyclohydrolase II
MYVPQRVIRPHTSWRASTDLPTRHGPFKMHVFVETLLDGSEKEHIAMVFGEVAGRTEVPVRVHSECLTSEVFGSLKCDCREQLEAALEAVARKGFGAVLYLRQEGRGIGLVNKVRAYDLQAKGHDTVDANRLLGLPDDTRTYDSAKAMLDYLQVASIELMTNNPDKVAGLTALGVHVAARIPVVVAPNPFSSGYLETKRARMAHLLPAYTPPSGALALQVELQVELRAETPRESERHIRPVRRSQGDAE